MTTMSKSSKLGMRSLNWSANTWFATMLVGQWLFVAYLLGVYLKQTILAGADGWSDTPMVNGYMENDPVGNSALMAHVLLAIIIHGFGPLQLIPYVRKKWPVFHRWNGRVFVGLSLIITLAGFYMTWGRPPGFGGLAGQIGISVLAGWILLFTYFTVKNGVQRNIVAHRKWALRLFMVVSGVWFIRLMLYGTIFGMGVSGIDPQPHVMTAFNIINVGQWLIPLALLQLYFIAQSSKNNALKYVTSATIFGASGLMLWGIVSVSILAWFPEMGLLSKPGG